MRKLLATILLFAFLDNLDAMTWVLSNSQKRTYTVSFYPDKNSENVKLIIKCDGKSLAELPYDIQKLFKEDRDEFFYSTGDNCIEEPDSSINSKSEQDQSKDFDRLVCNGNPRKISVEELATIIKNKKVIFYTGAGISAGSVPTMDELMRNLGISKELKKYNSLHMYIVELIRNSKTYIGVLQNFFDRCRNAQPSKAHTVLARIIAKQNQLLVMENVDQLHQKTELIPFVFAGNNVYDDDEKIKTKLTEADFIIAIGLNFDESGFLNFYKQLNPKGRIVSINLKCTDYLSDDDMLIIGDIQNVFGKLEVLMNF